MSISRSDSYAAAGVDVTAGYEAVNRIKPLVESTKVPGVIGGLGGFGGLFAPQMDGMKEPVLVSGTDHTITPNTAAGRGFTAIMVSWLAKFNPLFMVLTSLLLVFMELGAKEISTVFGLNTSFSEIIAGIIIFFIIGSEFFINYSIKRTHAKEVESK